MILASFECAQDRAVVPVDFSKRKKGRGGRPNVFVQEEEKWSWQDGMFSPAAALCQTSPSLPKTKQHKKMCIVPLSSIGKGGRPHECTLCQRMRTEAITKTMTPFLRSIAQPRCWQTRTKNRETGCQQLCPVKVEDESSTDCSREICAPH